MKPQAQLAEDRKNFILSKQKLVPTGNCNYCGFSIPKLALWCCTECAQSFAAEKAALLP